MRRKNLLCSLIIGVIVLFGAPFAFADYEFFIEPTAPDQQSVDQSSSSIQFEDDPVSAEAAGTGTIKVVNNSSYCAQVYVDDVRYCGDLKTGYTCTVTNVPRGKHELYADVCTGAGYWGPTNIRMRRGMTYTWTLTD